MIAAGDLIYSYTRRQALEDGVLVASTAIVRDEDLALQAGFRYPVAFTASVAALIPAPAHSMTDTKGRLWDVLYMGILAIRVAKARGQSGSELTYLVRLGRRNVHLKLVVGPGDDAVPVITIMLPHED